MRIIFSILISLSVLTGTVGVNLLNSACTCFGGEQLCSCSTSCAIEHSEATATQSDCCGGDEAIAREDNSSFEESCGCSSSEILILDVPLILVYDTHKIEVPEIELPAGFNFFFCESIVQRAFENIELLPDKPPPLIRSGLDLSCTFLC